MVNASTRWFTRPENATSMTEFLLTHPNEHYLGGMLGHMLMATIFIIVFVNTMNGGKRRAYTAASFFVFLTATIFVVLGLIGMTGWAVAFIMLLAGIVINNPSRGGTV